MIKVKKLLSGESARLKIKEGIDLVADYTKVTLGPKGRNIALNQHGPLPTRVVNDGVTIANEVKSEDSFVQAGVEMVQEICKKTNFNAGDGTTQTALLAQAIIDEGQKRLLSGINPVDIKNSLEKDLKDTLVELDGMSRKVENTNDIRNIATISGNNDEEIGNAVAKIMDEVGLNASIIIEKGDSTTIKTESVKGMWFNKGARGPMFMNTAKMTAEYQDPSIFFINDKLRWFDEILPLFAKIEKAGIKRVVIIAEEIEGEALSSLAESNLDRVKTGQGVFICVVEAPFAGEDRKEILTDMAIYTGGKVIDSTNDFDKIDVEEMAGTCKKFVATPKTTTMIKGAGKEEDVKARVDSINGLINQLDSGEKTIKENLEKRKDTLESGVGIIYAGGSTEIEIKDRMLRLEDAVLASKSAVKEGYVEGGGLTYLKLTSKINSEIFWHALRSIMRQIAHNAGKSPESILEKCLDSGLGYNAKNDRFEDLIEAGVIDATLVVKNALMNAVSLAGLFLTTEGLIVEELEKTEYDFNKPRIRNQ